MKNNYNPIPGVLGDMPEVPPCPVKIIPPAQRETPNKKKGRNEQKTKSPYRRQNR